MPDKHFPTPGSSHSVHLRTAPDTHARISAVRYMNNGEVTMYEVSVVASVHSVNFFMTREQYIAFQEACTQLVPVDKVPTYDSTTGAFIITEP